MTSTPCTCIKKNEPSIHSLKMELMKVTASRDFFKDYNQTLKEEIKELKENIASMEDMLRRYTRNASVILENIEKGNE